VHTKKGFLPKAIQFFQRNRYNHTGVFVWLYEKLYVCEAAQRGIVLTPFKRHYYNNLNKKYDFVVKRVDLESNTREKRIDIAKYMLDRCGNVPYDFINLLFYQSIKFASYWILKKPIWVGGDTEKADKRFICGEWNCHIYHKFFGMFPDKWHKMSPSELFNDPRLNEIITLK
jgi:hypothetical protein